MAKGQDAHNLEKVVDPDRFQEKRYVIHYHQQIYKGGLFACQSHPFFFAKNSIFTLHNVAILNENFIYDIPNKKHNWELTEPMFFKMYSD